MRMARVMAVLVTLLGSFTIAAALQAGGSSPAPASGEGAWSARVLACATARPTGASFDYNSDCLQSLWESAFRESRLKDLNEALYTQQQRDPVLGVVCHDLGHKAGQQAFSEFKDAAALIGQAASDRYACNNGFVHGVLDGLASSSPGEEDISAAFRECQKLQGEARANCIDGAGHASWQVAHDLEKAYEMCTLFDDSRDTRVCASGVIMQMFRADTAGGRPAEIKHEDAARELSRRCPPLLEKFPQEMALECFATAGQPFTNDADVSTRQAFADSPSSLAPEQAEELKALWRAAFDRCAVFADFAEGKKGCEDFVAGAVVWTAPSTSYLQPLCSAFPARVVSECLSAKMA